jgi:hypothetical protein
LRWLQVVLQVLQLLTRFHFRFPGEADVDRSSLLADRDANGPKRTFARRDARHSLTDLP